MKAYAYNKKSMKKYGWGPEDLDLPVGASDEDVYLAVKLLQQNDPALDVDGYVGPQTVRRVLLMRTLRLDDTDVMGSLLVGGKVVPVPFRARIATPTGSMSLIQEGDYNERDEDPTQCVWHWDVAKSAKSCRNILAKRGYSSHGCIDNDGTFYQFLDFRNHTAWHAGKRKVNRASIGIDLSNAVYSKYQKWYKKRFGPRPVITAKVNGYTHKNFLGYYPAQVETARELAFFMSNYMGIKLATPSEANVIADPHKFEGHIGHYHITKRKWDPSGLNFKYIIGEVDEL